MEVKKNGPSNDLINIPTFELSFKKSPYKKIIVNDKMERL